MTTVGPTRLRGAHATAAVGRFTSGLVAVGTKELRGRMRGRRAFVVLTLYLLLLSVFAWGIYQFQRQSYQNSVEPFIPAVPAAAVVGQAIFSGLLMLETLLVLVLAPAMTSGAISMEREKQTLDLLVTTPLGTLALVLGKLLSALTYVFLLILASIPLASIVFTFGGVGPEDLVRGYVLLFALAFGTGAIALFYSALVRRTQAATVLSYLTVLAITLGATVVFIFWLVMASEREVRGGFFDERVEARRPSQAVMLLNPFVAAADVICGTSTGGPATGARDLPSSCEVVGRIVGQPLLGGFGAPRGAIDTGDCPPNGDCRGVAVPEPADIVAPNVDLFDVPRDRLWPQIAAAFVGLGVLLTLLSSQLVSPTRRVRFPRRRRSDHAAAEPAPPGVPPEPIAGEQVTT